MGIEVQKSALPTLFNFARVRAAHQPHVNLKRAYILQSWPNALAHSATVKAETADFFLKPPTLTASNFEAL